MSDMFRLTAEKDSFDRHTLDELVQDDASIYEIFLTFSFHFHYFSAKHNIPLHNIYSPNLVEQGFHQALEAEAGGELEAIFLAWQ